MFLPETYTEVPTSGGRFMKFKQGDNIFRILSSAIVGWEKWTKVDEKREVERFQIDNKPDGEGVKHFWAFVVWNYANNQLELLHITQSGIQKDNVHDMINKGRKVILIGEDHPMSKLKTSDVLIIRKLYKEKGLKAPKLSKMFKISDGNIRNIVKRRTWKHV